MSLWFRNISNKAFLGALLLLCHCSDRKIGYIDQAILLNEFDMALEVRAALKTETDRMQAQAQQMAQELEALRQRFIQETPRLSSAQQNQLRAEMAEREQAYGQFLQQANQQMAALEAEKMAPVYTALNESLQQYGREQGYFLILGATANGSIVYADTTSNLTPVFLNYIRERRKTAK